MRKWKQTGWAVILIILLLQSTLPAHMASAEGMTKYRVYQNSRILKEFSSVAQAKAYAVSFRNSHVEEIGTRSWIWNNLPKYKVYHEGLSKPEWGFRTLPEALKEAEKWTNTSIRDLESTGWIWNNYPTYQLFQGDRTVPTWGFADLKLAQKAAKSFANAHIIELKSNRWVWDNIKAATKQQLRKGVAVYEVKQSDGAIIESYAYLEDAIKAALLSEHAVEVINTTKGTTVYTKADYHVFQNDRKVNSFVSLELAIGYAKNFTNTSVIQNGAKLWTNAAYYQIYQGDRKILATFTLSGALAKAKSYMNASILTSEGLQLWDNFKKLVYMGWNGTSSQERIISHVDGTQGLDIDSPTWYALKNELGDLDDSSSAATVEALKAQGMAVHPLIHNQFDTKLTSKFLNNPAAQSKFITAVISSAVQVGAKGLNLDFEALSANDRAAYTAFVQQFAKAAYGQKLTFSIDLPRGSLLWNHKTAYDHVQLAKSVDYLIIMAYDQHYSGSDTPGSVAGLPWVEEGIQEFLSYGIERSKIMLGIPFYVRQWTLDSSGKLLGNKSLLLSDLPVLINEKKATLSWDAQYGQYRAEYKENGSRYVFWLEDTTTIKARIQLAKKYDLAGVAAWRLGYEPDSLWSDMLKLK